MKTQKNTSKKINSAKAKAPASKKAPVLKKSRIDHPVEICWATFERHQKKLGKDISRKGAMEDCQKQGVAYYTARTQYQLWRQAGVA